MKKQDNITPGSSILRKKAERLLKKMPESDESQNSDADTLKLFHELEVYKIELEMQNDELRLAKMRADELATEKYTELYDFAPAGIFTLSKEGKIIGLNLYGSQMLDKERIYLINSRFGFFVSDDTKQNFKHFLGKVFNNKHKESCEVTLLSEGKLPMYVYLTAIRNNNEEQCLLTAVDITKRKETEKALFESNEHFRLLFENSSDAIFFTNPDGTIYSVNPEAGRMLGRSQKEIKNLGRNKISDLSDPRLIPALEERSRTGRFKGELNYLRKNGISFPVDITSTLFKDSNGIERASIIARDITERKLAENSLRESEERVRFKLQSILSPEGSIADLELMDIIDAPSIQQLMDSFFELVQIPVAIIDNSGKILVGVGWQEICTKFHRVHPQACRNCFESDVYLTDSIPDGEFKLYKCKNNMWDIATPIIIGGEHKGNLFMGQFFFDSEPIDYELFRQQANQYGFAEQKYMDAVDKVPRISLQKLEHAKAFFLNLAHSVSQLSYSNIKLARAITQQKKVEEALKRLNEELESRVAERTSNLLELNVALLQTEEKYRTVADYTYAWEYWINAEGSFNYVSPSCERISGYSVAEFIKDPELLDQIIFNADKEVWENHKKEEHYLLPLGTNPEFNFRIVTKTGKIRWICSVYRRITVDGKYAGIRASNRDITEKIDAENELLNVTIEVEERERNRFSSELHDGLGPLLSTIKLYFQWLAETDDAAKAKIITEKGNNNIDIAIQSTHDVALGLSSLILNKTGFVDTLLNYTQNINELQKLTIDFSYNSRERFSYLLEITLYRITTELINNTMKYANASLIDIVYNYQKKNNLIVFTYSDNGIGFDLADTKKTSIGLGLLNIQQRIKIIRGIIRIETGIGKGIKVHIELPVIEPISGFSPISQKNPQYV